LIDVSLTDVIKVMYEDEEVDFDRRSVYELEFDASNIGESTGDYTFSNVSIQIKDWIVTESPGGWIW
jgi:hypothetical protein